MYVSEKDIALGSVVLTTCDIVRLSGVNRRMPIQRSICSLHELSLLHQLA